MLQPINLILKQSLPAYSKSYVLEGFKILAYLSIYASYFILRDF